VELDYIDDDGHVLNAKEAFRLVQIIAYLFLRYITLRRAASPMVVHSVEKESSHNNCHFKKKVPRRKQFFCGNRQDYGTTMFLYHPCAILTIKCEPTDGFICETLYSHHATHHVLLFVYHQPY
jgi:hypothetical protein